MYSGDDVLEIMAKNAPRRHDYIEGLIRNAFGLRELSEPVTMLEFGAGRGIFIDRFLQEKMVKTAVVERETIYLKELSQRHQGYASLEEVSDGSLDFIYLIDVLEHLEDDRYFLELFHQKLKPQGKVLIYVPARQELFSEFDTRIGHFRRYHKRELAEKVQAAGFQIDTLRYHELLGYFAAFYNRLFAKDGELNAKAVAFYDRFFVPPTNWLEKLLAPPIGKSLYVVARK